METLPGVLNELLTRPLAFLERTRNGGAASSGRLLAVSALCYALYGAAAGAFQGGDQILVAALKAPLPAAKGACPFEAMFAEREAAPITSQAKPAVGAGTQLEAAVI